MVVILEDIIARRILNCILLSKSKTKAILDTRVIKIKMKVTEQGNIKQKEN